MKEIQLTKGKVALIDDEDFAIVSQHKWHAINQEGEFYARGYIPGRRYVFLANFLMNPPAGMLVDHANNNPLDNRRSNLRLATPSQNNANSRKTWTPTSSIYKGVCWHKRWKKWVAQIGQGPGNGPKTLGYFASEEEAARAYDAAAKARWGEFAKLNFPE